MSIMQAGQSLRVDSRVRGIEIAARVRQTVWRLRPSGVTNFGKQRHADSPATQPDAYCHVSSWNDNLAGNTKHCVHGGCAAVSHKRTMDLELPF